MVSAAPTTGGTRPTRRTRLGRRPPGTRLPTRWARTRCAPGSLGAEDEPTLLRLQRRLFSDAALALDATRRARLLGWLLPLAVTVFGGIIRFWRLAVPHNLVFDETYYVKEAYSMLVRGYEASWGQDPNPRFEAGDVSMLQVDPEYVVHPRWASG